MALDFLEVKKKARLALHETLAVSAIFIDKDTKHPLPCKVRVHTKIQLSGDIDYQGFAELSSGHVFIHLLREDAENLDVREGDYLVFDEKLYRFDTRREDDGILLESWYAVYDRWLEQDEAAALERGETDWL